MTNGENEEEAAWLDLIANYDAPAGESPWPAREDLAAQDSAPIPGTATRSPYGPDAPQASGQQAALGPPLSSPGPARGDVTPGDTAPGNAAPGEPHEEHYIPPPPPPLPKLDPIAKGAWTALFGGPAYLLIATAIGWTVPALAAFCAIGAFVGGFAILVLRMGDEPPRGSDGDNGAVVLPSRLPGVYHADEAAWCRRARSAAPTRPASDLSSASLISANSR